MLPTERRARRPIPGTSIPSMSTVRTMPGRWSASRPQAPTARSRSTQPGCGPTRWTTTIRRCRRSMSGDTLIDTFTATTVDGTEQPVTITINGRNDAAVISGAAIGSVVEAGGANGTLGVPTATGDLRSSDLDNPNDAWEAVSVPTASSYGSYTLTAAGVWDLHAGQQQCGRAGAQCGRDADRHLHGGDNGRHPAAGDHHHQRRQRHRRRSPAL